MAEQTWDLNPDRLRTSATNIQELEARIRQVPPSQRSNYQLRMMGIEIPPGYRLDPQTGRLQYVAVNNEQHWYNKPEIMIPLIMSAGMTYGSTGGFGLANAGTQGAVSGAAGAGTTAASTGIPTISSTAYPALNLSTPSLAGASTINGVVGGTAAVANAIPEIASRPLTNGMGYDPASLANTGRIPSQLSPNVSPSSQNTPSGDTPSGGGNVPAWQDLVRMFGPLAAGLGGRAIAGSGDGGTGTTEMPEQLRELLDLQINRVRQSQPNYETMLRMVSGLQPEWAREGGSTPRVAEPRY